MTEKLKTVAIIMLLIISLILIVACRNSMRSVILPGYNLDQDASTQITRFLTKLEKDRKNY